MRSSPHEAWGCGFNSAFGSGVMTIGVESGDPTAMAPSSVMNATLESPLIAIACASVELSRNPLSAVPQVVVKLPPYVDVSALAVESTEGSGAGSDAKDSELESRVIADMVEVLALIVLVEVAVFDAGVAAATGLRSVVASTTI